LFPLFLIVAWSGAAQPLPPEPSTITIPIRTDLKPIASEIEKRVDAKFAGKTTERGIDIRYDVARDPIHLRMIGSGLHSLTTINYAMEACRGRFPCVSCGYGESRRAADITLQTALSWDPSWRLRSSTRLLPVNYAKPCEVTWLGIDITKRFVAPVVEKQLGDAAKIIDKNVPALTNIRPQAEQIWTALQTPYELAPRTWLVLEPTDVALSPITGASSTVTTTLSLHTTTRVIATPRRCAARTRPS